MPLALSRRVSRPSAFTGPHAASNGGAANIVSETDLDRILKLIPTEVLALYTGALPLASEVPSRHFTFIMFVACLVLVPVVLVMDGKATGQTARWPQHVLRMLAFCVWAMACSWPFAAWVSADNTRWVVALGVLLVPFLGALILREKSPVPPST
jgi:hypothetical protein